MAGKLFFMRFVPEDWTKKTWRLTDRAKAVWIDALCFLFQHAPDTGSVTLPLSDWAKALDRSPSNALTALSELQGKNVATIAPKLTAMTPAHEEITVTSRRMARDAVDRGEIRARKRDSRSSHVTPHVTPDVTPMSRNRHAPEIEARDRGSETRTSSSSASVASLPQAPPPLALVAEPPRVPKKPKAPRPVNPRWEAAGKVLAHYAGIHPDYRPDKAGHTLVIALLSAGYSVEDLCLAIDGAHRSEWHQEQGALGIGVILGTTAQVTKFIERARVAKVTNDAGIRLTMGGKPVRMVDGQPVPIGDGER